MLKNKIISLIIAIVLGPLIVAGVIAFINLLVETFKIEDSLGVFGGLFYVALFIILPILVLAYFSRLTQQHLKLSVFWVLINLFLSLSVIVTMVLLLSRPRTAGSGDAKRLADVRQMASALELYFNDKGQYPQSLPEMTPTYIGVIPNPKAYVKSKNCTEAQNFYFYERASQLDYKLTFCLSAATGDYKPGTHVLTPKGIE